VADHEKNEKTYFQLLYAKSLCANVLSTQGRIAELRVLLSQFCLKVYDVAVGWGNQISGPHPQQMTSRAITSVCTRRCINTTVPHDFADTGTGVA